MLSVCRVCLASNTQLYSLKNKLSLVDVYEKLSNTQSISARYFHSIMSYGILLWGKTADINTVFVLQKRAVHAIYNIGPRESLHDKFKEINIMTVPWQCIRFYNKTPNELQNLSIIKFKSIVKNILCKKAYYKISDYLDDKNVWDEFCSNSKTNKFNTVDARPRAFCSFCYQKLLKCHSFSQMAQKTEKIFNILYDKSLKPRDGYLRKVNVEIKQDLSVATLPFITIDGDASNAYSQETIRDESLSIDDLEEDTTEEDKLMVIVSLPKEVTESPLDEDSDQGMEVEELTSYSNDEETKDDSIMHGVKISDSNLSDKTFREQSELTEQTIQRRVKSFPCSICNEHFFRYADLTRHQRTHSGEKPFACNLCDEKFRHKISLVDHTRIVHIKLEESEKKFCCNLCGGQFIKKLDYNRHTKTHVKPFACTVCDNKQFNTLSDLVEHMKNHYKEQPSNICGKPHILMPDLVLRKTTHVEDKATNRNVCGRELVMNDESAKPMANDIENKLFACYICDNQFNMIGDLAKHMRVHAGVKAFACHVCDNQHKQNPNSNLAKPMADQIEAKPFACNICDNQFDTMGYLMEHRKIHYKKRQSKKYNQKPVSVNPMRTDTEEKQLTEDVCNKELNSNGDLANISNQTPENQGLRKHTTVKKDFYCNICNRKLASRNSLRTHQSIHTGEKPFGCKVCGRNFSQKPHLVTHMRLHTGDKPFTCDVCGKQFTTNGSLVLHMNVHTKEKPFGCNECGKYYSHKRLLAIHIRSHTRGKIGLKNKIQNRKRYNTNTRNKLFGCDVCGKKYTNKSYIVDHMRIHTGEKPFACNVCNEQFSTKHKRYLHQLHHTGLKQFACKLCDKRYYQSSHLSTHMLTHIGVKSFTCDKCGKQFYTNGSLVEHMSVHGLRRYTCNACDKKFTRKNLLVSHIMKVHTE